MSQLTFKSNINCSSCIQKVTPILNTLEGVEEWQVNTADPNKILTVEVDQLEENDIVAALEKIGFTAIPYSHD